MNKMFVYVVTVRQDYAKHFGVKKVFAREEDADKYCRDYRDYEYEEFEVE